MKNVVNPETMEVVTIDETQEKDWMSKYLHVSGKPFEGAKPVEKLTKEELEAIATEHGLTLEPVEEVVDEVPESTPIEELQELYKEKYGKMPASAYKNRREWIISKL